MSGQEFEGITAGVLVGGLGFRLRSVVNDRPKVLAEVRRRSFLAYLLDKILSAGIREVVLCTGYMGEVVKAEFGETYRGIRLVYSYESSPLGTGGALKFAMPMLKSNPVLIMNGDSFCDVTLNSLWFWHFTHNANATMVLVKVSDTGRYGHVNIDSEGRVVSFNEKADQGTPGWINAGVYLVSRSLLQTIPENRAVSLEREIFPSWIGNGLYGYQTEAQFLDIGTPEGYSQAERFFAPQEKK